MIPALNLDIILPALASLSVVFLILGKLYFKIRIRFPIKVDCWFCNCTSSIPYNSSNSWYCPHCDQYNGFTSDGGYNRLLPEQFNERLNPGSWCTKQKPKSPVSNGLCQFCNINLELKVQQLAQFVPLNKDNYDEEVQQYSDQLERVYRLCSRCQTVLQNTLNAKQKRFGTNQQHSFTPLVDHSFTQPREKERHSAYLTLTAVLSLGLLITVIPHYWISHLLDSYPPPDYILEVLNIVQAYIPHCMQSSTALLSLGVVVQLFDCAHMKDITSLVNLLLWVILLSLTRVPVQVDGLISVVHMLAGVMFFITSIMERKSGHLKSLAAEKPVQFQKLDVQSEKSKRSTLLDEEELKNKLLPNINKKSPVSEPSSIRPVSPSLFHDPTPEDFGFSKLNVSSRRLTRSQTRHFPTKQFESQRQNDLFQPKPVTLSPPKLKFEKTLEYQGPVTRSSSQSSGYISLSHQKDFDERRSPSVIGDDFDSISQCNANGPLIHYQSSFTPTSFSPPFGMPFPQFHPYTVMQYNTPPFNKFYQYAALPGYEPSLNMSSLNVHNNSVGEGWFQTVKNVAFSFLFLFLITSNVAILWKVFGEEYFKQKT